MQSPDQIQPTADPQTKALGCLALIGLLLALPLLCALFLYFVTVAVWSYHSFVQALNGA